MTNFWVNVVGTGAWGTALACHFAKFGPVQLIARDEARAAQIAGGMTSPRLPGVTLPANIRLGIQLQPGILTCFALPFGHLRQFLGEGYGHDGLIIAAKGITRDGLLAPTLLAGHGIKEYAVMSGPSFAGDLAAGRPVALALAAPELALATRWAAQFHDELMRVYPDDDPMGVALGGAVKNVIALACGVARGAGLGDSAVAALASRGFAEIRRLGEAMGCRPETLMGLAGFGDLFLTASSTQSRNMQFGMALGEGCSPDEAKAKVFGVVEGVDTLKGLLALANQQGIELPIALGLAQLLDGKFGLHDLIKALATRPMAVGS